MSSIWTIRRSTGDAKLAGVCAGVARHWNVDPLLVRIGCVLLALSGGIGLVLYAAGWLLIPPDTGEKPVVADLLGESANRLSREACIAIVVIACVVSFAVLGSVTPFGFGPAVILALIWYFGYYRPRLGKTQPGPSVPPATPPAVPPTPPIQFYSYSGPPTPFTQAADAWRERVIQVQQHSAAQSTAPVSSPTSPPPVQRYATSAQPTVSWTAEPEDRTEPTGWAQPPDPSDRQAFFAHPDPVGLYTPEPVVQTPAPVRVKPADRPSARRLRLVGLVVLGLTLSGLAIADSVGVAVPTLTYLAAALLVIGLTLIAATWFGRARGILPVGVVLALITTGVAAAPQLPAQTQWQSAPIAYAHVAELPAGGDHRDVGNLDVDLSKLAMTRDADYAASVDVGRLRVTVPPKVNVVVHYRIDAGSVTVFGTQRDSETERSDTFAEPAKPGQPTLTLDLRADVGQIEVNR